MLNWIEDNIGIPKIISGIIIPIVLILVLAGLFRATCVDWVDNYELGYLYDARSGEIQILNRTGYFITYPLVVKVHTVDMRPMQTCISSNMGTMTSNKRVLNCKLVQFQREGLKQFLDWHGRDNYNDEKLNPILQAYAYEGSGKNYSFLKIIRELKNSEQE